MLRRLLSWRFWSVLLLFAALTPLLIDGTRGALTTNSNDVSEWLPEGFKESQDLEWFSHRFGSDGIAMISWEGCTLDDPRLSIVAERLKRPPHPGGKPLFSDVVTGAAAMDRLTGDPLNLSRQEARRRLEGWLIGEHGTTCVVVVFTGTAYEDPQAAIEFIRRCCEIGPAADRPGLREEDVHLAGPALESAAIDEASHRWLLPLNLACYAVSFALMLVAFRSIWLSFMLFLNAVLSQACCLAIIYYSPHWAPWVGLPAAHMDSVMLVAPSLCYVLVISAGVHLLNYYKDEVRERGLAGAHRRAMLDALSPCSLSAATTALGLVSLVVSMLVPVRNFGIYSALAVLCGTGLVLLLLPWQLYHFPPVAWARRARQNRDAPREGWTAATVDRLRSVRWPIIAAAALTLVFSVFGVSRLETTARIHDLFSPQAQVLRDYEWLERNVGPLVPVEIVIEIPSEADVPEEERPALIDRLQFIGRIQQTAAADPDVEATASAVTFAPELPPAHVKSWRTLRDRRLIEAHLQSNNALDGFRELGYVLPATEKEGELWRISARVDAGNDVDYGDLLSRLRRKVGDEAKRAEEEGFPPVRITYTGGIPVAEKAQDQMLSDLIASITCAFGFITLAMVALFAVAAWRSGLAASMRKGSEPLDVPALLWQSVLRGLLCMIPNVLPTLAVFGAMGLLGAKVEVGSVLTATVAMGVAVDDTLHFVTWFQRSLAAGNSRPRAVRTAYHRCAVAMLQTTAICGLGLLVFSVSSFIPIARFAWLLSAMLGAAIVGDLFVLPALLLTPLGSVFGGDADNAGGEPGNMPEQQPQAARSD